jgi:hypothetical protein
VRESPHAFSQGRYWWRRCLGGWAALKWVIIGALVVGWILLQISYKASAASRHKRPGCIRAALGFVALFVLVYAILFTVQRWESAGSPFPLP